MKVPFLSILDNDFIDHLGVRHTHFSLCRVDHGKTRACAVVAFADNAVVREAFSSGLSHRADAIRRLASIHRQRSTPLNFSRAFAGDLSTVS